MHISANLNRRSQLQQHRLAKKHIPRLVAKLGGVGDGDFDGGARFFVAGSEKLLDHAVDPGVIGSGGHGGGKGVGEGRMGSSRRLWEVGVKKTLRWGFLKLVWGWGSVGGEDSSILSGGGEVLEGIGGDWGGGGSIELGILR